jgi:hypothetical protein
MPKVDGVTRCLARLLQHLRAEGHEVVVMGPESGLGTYESYPLIGTLGIPLVSTSTTLTFGHNQFIAGRLPRLETEFPETTFHSDYQRIRKCSLNDQVYPRILTSIDQDPDVIHFVDPIWLGAQVMLALEWGLCGKEWSSSLSSSSKVCSFDKEGSKQERRKKAIVASYQTNLAAYASLFGLKWLEPVSYRLQSCPA